MNIRNLVSAIVLIIAGVIIVLSLSFQQVRIGAAEFVNSLFFVPGGPDLIKNGSLENGNFSGGPGEGFDNNANCRILCGGSSSLDKWQIVKQGIAGSQDCNSAIDAVCWVRAPDNLKINAADRVSFVDLTGEAAKPPTQFGEIRQDVEGTEAGSTYELSFYIGTSSAFPPAQPIGKSAFYRIDVDVLGVPNGQVPFTIPPGTTDLSDWEPQTMRFRASGPTTTLIFSGDGSAGVNGNGGEYLGIDNITLRKVCFLVSAILFQCRM